MLLHFVLELLCSIILPQILRGTRRSLVYNPGRNNMEQNPLPPKSMLKSREEKNAPFCILDLVGRGGLSVPFKKSEIVGSAESRHSRGGEEGGLLINVWVQG